MAEIENQQENVSFPEENEENKNLSSMINAHQAFLTELNLILILSYLSCSKETIDFDEVSETEYVKEQIVKHSNSCLPKKSKDLSDFRAFGRQHASRFQPKMVDCRHNRRM